MATAQANPRQQAPQSVGQGPLQEAEHEAVSLKTLLLRLFNKFNNDWTMNLAAMVSYNVLTSFFPLLLALITILAFIPSAFGNTTTFARQINQILPSDVQSSINVESLVKSVNAHAGLLSLISILGLLWSGTNLFGSIESAFAIIYRVKTRDFLQQKLMCLLMIIITVILLPLSFFSSVGLSAATTTLGKILPGVLTGPFGVIIAFSTSLASLLVLFLAIYIVVPNVPVRWHDAWRGALVAAVAMWVINAIFPQYTAHFVNTKQYSGAFIGSAIIAITWFWFFSVILLIGAQVNSVVMGLGPWPFDITRILMDYKVPPEEGAPTAPEVQEPRAGEALPFSGVVRDSQNVHDDVPPAQKIRKAEKKDKRGSGQHGDRDGTPPSSAHPPNRSADRQSSHAGGRDSRGMRTPARDGDNSSTLRHTDAASVQEGPRPAHEMPADMVATGIVSGGVGVARPVDVFGDSRGPMRGMVIAGAVVGVISGLLRARRERD